MVVVAGEGSLLQAAALAGSRGASEGTVHCHDFSFRVELLDSHLVGVAWSTAEAAAKACVFKRVEHLSITDKVLEFGFGLTSQNLLTPSSTSLAHFKLLKPCHVRLEGLRATFHLVGLHGELFETECAWKKTIVPSLSERAWVLDERHAGGGKLLQT
jgi:hypothetical protein